MTIAGNATDTGTHIFLSTYTSIPSPTQVPPPSPTTHTHLGLPLPLLCLVLHVHPVLLGPVAGEFVLQRRRPHAQRRQVSAVGVELCKLLLQGANLVGSGFGGVGVLHVVAGDPVELLRQGLRGE